MNVVIYSNCQGGEIKKYLESSDFFNRYYKITMVFLPHHFNDNSLYNGGVNQTSALPEDLLNCLRTCDVFIHQPFSLRRGVFTTFGEHSVLNHLKADCKVISFPSIYADIFPIYIEGNRIKGLSGVKKMIDDGFTKSEIIDKFKTGKLDFNLKTRFDYSIKFMQNKEQHCTIKTSEFILENIRSVRLFDTQNHPTEILHGFVTNKIFEVLGIDHQIDIFNMERYMINGVSGQFPDSFYMSNELGLTYTQNRIGDYYLETLENYLENPDAYQLLALNKTFYG